MILRSILEVIIFEYGCHFSALEQKRMLIFRRNVLLACINIINKYGHAYIKFQVLGLGALYQRFETH